MEGKTIGEKYQVLEKLREQCFYDVYEARVLNSDQRVLLKIIKKNLVDENTFRTLKPNLAVVASLRHEGASALRDYGEFEGSLYMVEDYFDGAVLKDIMAHVKSIEAMQALGQGIKIVDAVAAAHGRGVMHGLLSPESVNIGRDLAVKVGDFYFLHALTADLKTGAEFQGRDVVYCAPEVIAGGKPTFASDVYSIGILLYELFTGRPPFKKEGAMAIALEKESVEVKSPKTINPDIPRLLETVILKCIKRDPEARYEDARKLVTELHLCRSSMARAISESGSKLSQAGRNADLLGAAAGALGPGGRAPETRPATRPTVKFGDEWEPDSNESNDTEDNMENKRKLPQGFIAFLVSLFVLVMLVVFGYQYIRKALGPAAGGLPTVTVPGVVNKSIVEAKAILGQEGLTPFVAGQKSSAEVPEGYVVSQEPPAGARVKGGREIALVVSSGEQKASVPKVVALTIEDAQVMLETAGFAVGEIREEYDQSEPEGFVTSQVPEPGEERYLGFKVILTVSKGQSPHTVAMPRLVNMKESDARAILDMNNLKRVQVKRMETGAVLSGFVVAQSVLENVRVDPNDEVTLYVASPPSAMSLTEAKGVVNLNISTANDFQEVMVLIFDQENARQAYRQVHQNGETAEIEISGKGRTHVMVYLDGVLAKEQTL